MGKFNLSEYATVEQRIADFYEKCPEGRITTYPIYQDGQRTLVRAEIYLNAEEQSKGLALASGLAEEIRVMSKSKTADGREYEEVNYSSWTENCETSAIGRALANWNLTGNIGDKKAPRVSRDEMQKVERVRSGELLATEKQKDYIKNLAVKKGVLPDAYVEDWDQLTMKEASKIIEEIR